MNKQIVVFLLSVFFIVPAHAEIIKTNGDGSGVPVTIDITEGEHWKHFMWVSKIIPVWNRPQIAVWAETPGGDFITTLYVTHRSATQNWRGGNVRRPGSLPYWSHRRGVEYSDGYYMPPKDAPLPDTMTAATPKQGFTLESNLHANADSIVVFVEANHSFDTNDAFPKKTGGVNGQPSAVYRAVVDCATLPATAAFSLAGYGSPDGSDGKLYTDTEKLTTGKDIVGDMTVTVGE